MQGAETPKTASRPPRLLVVDDEASARSALVDFFEEEGYEVRGVGDAFKALGKVEGWHPDVVLTDLAMPGMNGLTLLSRLRSKVPALPVILMTAYGTVDDAVQAHHDGATDFVVKPLQLDHVLAVVQRALKEASLLSQTQHARKLLSTRDLATSLGLVARSRAMGDVLRDALLVANTSANLMIRGEYGTGRSTLAKVLHDVGPRKDRPFVEVHCRGQGLSRIVRTLFGSVGTEGGEAGRRGAVDRARGGTLVLDEIEALPHAVQSRLVDMIESGTFTRGDEQVDVDVRIVGITSASSVSVAAEEEIRPELQYLVGVMELELPTLREREEDIELLTRHFARECAHELSITPAKVSSRALATLTRYPWPGNVSQLRQVISASVASAGGAEIQPRSLPDEVKSASMERDRAPVIPGASLEEVERWAIVETLRFTGGSSARTAKILGVSPRKIQYRIAEYRDAGLLD